MLYRRANAKGATYFITANIVDRRVALLTDHIDLLRNAFRLVKQRYPFSIDALVVMPDHFHLLMTLPANDANFSRRISAIKSLFTKHLPATERLSLSRIAKRERGVWQRRFWEHTIRDDADFANHVAYIHFNPVKHGYVARATDWPHSSIHRFIAKRIIDSNWAVNPAQGDYGEDGK